MSCILFFYEFNLTNSIHVYGKKIPNLAQLFVRNKCAVFTVGGLEAPILFMTADLQTRGIHHSCCFYFLFCFFFVVLNKVIMITYD